MSIWWFNQGPLIEVLISWMRESLLLRIFIKAYLCCAKRIPLATIIYRTFVSEFLFRVYIGNCSGKVWANNVSSSVQVFLCLQTQLWLRFMVLTFALFILLFMIYLKKAFEINCTTPNIIIDIVWFTKLTTKLHVLNYIRFYFGVFNNRTFLNKGAPKAIDNY